MSKEATEHQKIVHSQTTGLDNNTCPQCKSEGGQYLDIENKGESWTQTYCGYCKEYLNLDHYYNSNINEEDTLYFQLREKREPLKILNQNKNEKIN